MVRAAGVRIRWADLPSAVRGAVERGLGSRVVAAISQPGGFSPGTVLQAADRAVAGLAGQTLVHGDLRADNLLLRADGRVILVDWPHACRGPVWLDRVLLCVNLLLYGGVDVDPLVAQLAADATVAEDLLVDVLTGYAGYFLDAARQPPVPGLPTIRAFQQAQADALLPWVRRWMTDRLAR